MSDNRTLRQRFYDMMCPEPNTGCWLWMGSVNHAGYGLIGVRPSRPGRAHRVSYELHRGPIPSGLEVCHKCDVRSCVNPDHLFLGTHQDNVRDKTAKGRNAVGDKIGISKLNWQKVAQIRAQLANGELQRVIAGKYGVDPSVISEIKTGKIWRQENQPA